MGMLFNYIQNNLTFFFFTDNTVNFPDKKFRNAIVDFGFFKFGNAFAIEPFMLAAFKVNG